MIDHHSHLRDEWANLTLFMPVLVLITRVIHRSTLHFAVSRKIQVESVEHIGKHDITISKYLKRCGRKVTVESLFSRS